MSSFSHPHVLTNLNEFLCSVKHKIHFEECWFLVAIDFFSYYGSQWETATVWLPTFIKMCCFMFNRRKKLIQVWHNMRVS